MAVQPCMTSIPVKKNTTWFFISDNIKEKEQNFSKKRKKFNFLPNRNISRKSVLTSFFQFWVGAIVHFFLSDDRFLSKDGKNWVKTGKDGGTGLLTGKHGFKGSFGLAPGVQKVTTALYRRVFPSWFALR